MAASYLLQMGVHTVTQSSPSPTISCVHNAPYIAEVSRITSADSVHGHSSYSSYGSTASTVLKDVHISARLMDDFLALARDNTDKDLETCGVLGASLRGGIFHVTTLIIPEQESTSSSALHEEEIFSIQNDQSLFPVGWIHTHPSQSCFMSSVDLHTQFSYQIKGAKGTFSFTLERQDPVKASCGKQNLLSLRVMVPEAIAIVMAPTDTTRSYGIFRLSDPGGMNILKECQETGHHPHGEPADGSSIYEHCSNVYVNRNIRLEICDLRQGSG